MTDVIPIDEAPGGAADAFDGTETFPLIQDGAGKFGTLDQVKEYTGGGNWYDSAELVDDVVQVTFTTPFGIDASTGVPYFDPGNVTAGEEAVLLGDLTLVQPGT